MRVRPQVPQAEAAAWGQVRGQGGGDGGGDAGHHGLAGGAGGGRGSAAQQEEWRRICWHWRQAGEDLLWSVSSSGLNWWSTFQETSDEAREITGAETMTVLSETEQLIIFDEQPWILWFELSTSLSCLNKEYFSSKVSSFLLIWWWLMTNILVTDLCLHYHTTRHWCTRKQQLQQSRLRWFSLLDFDLTSVECYRWKHQWLL